MWKVFWKTWTIDKPAMLGDWLWDVFVVQFAAFLDRLTLRQVVASIPIAILIVAYYHQIPMHPGLMLLGDLLAYIDIFSVIFLLGILSRAATILFVIKQAAARVGRSANALVTMARHLAGRHRRERGNHGRKRPGRSQSDDDEPAIAGGLAFA